MVDELTHFDAHGAARMVSIADKDETKRTAVARARVRMAAQTLARIGAGQIAKGDVLQISRIAAIGAAKATSTAIPLCHPVRLTGVDVAFTTHTDPAMVDIRVEVHAIDRTGPEMEALHAASVAALTIYDMCKSIDRAMTIEHIELLEKTGGKSGHFVREP
jgi:cyclic pyranopterin monophosphate synthase